jgi:hypothetical protein
MSGFGRVSAGLAGAIAITLGYAIGTILDFSFVAA